MEKKINFFLSRININFNKFSKIKHNRKIKKINKFSKKKKKMTKKLIFLLVEEKKL